MTWMQAVLAISTSLAWPAVIITLVVVLKRSWRNMDYDQHIISLPSSTRQVLREPGTKVVVYPRHPRTGEPMLDKPIRHRDMVRFDKAHPQWDRSSYCRVLEAA